MLLYVFVGLLTTIIPIIINTYKYYSLYGNGRWSSAVIHTLILLSFFLQLGGKVLFATDDWFAVAENLLKVSA